MGAAVLAYVEEIDKMPILALFLLALLLPGRRIADLLLRRPALRYAIVEWPKGKDNL